MNSDKIDYSIVVPVYNSERTLDELCDRVTKVFTNITDNFEIILVDDSSVDNSWKKMIALHENDKRIKIIHLLKNFGQHNAVLCGFHYSNGKYILTMDDDLQNPPEEILKLIEKIKEGYLVVIGKYSHKEHSIIRNLLSVVFMNISRKTLKIPQSIYLSSFMIYDSAVVKNMVSIKSAYPFLPALIFRSAPVNKIVNVDVIHKERKVGKSNYNFIKMVKLSLNLIINYSSLPLIAMGISGILISIISISFGIFIIAERIHDPSYGLMGWNSLMVAITLLDGVILMAIGVIGEYLRRILAELSYGKQYVVSEIYF